MFNVQQITSRLAEMSDAQLAQYARMHKDDPYVLPLASSEFKRRQQLRQSGRMPQAGPQPTVAQADLAQMAQTSLPEEQGIGVLPEQSLAKMADGGIAGYAGDNGSLVGYEMPFEWKTPFDTTGGFQTVYGTNTSEVNRKKAEQEAAAQEEASSPFSRAFKSLAAGPEGARERYEAQQAVLAKQREILQKQQELEGYGFKPQTAKQQAVAAQLENEAAAAQNKMRGIGTLPVKPKADPVLDFARAEENAPAAPTTVAAKAPTTAAAKASPPAAKETKAPGAPTAKPPSAQPTGAGTTVASGSFQPTKTRTLAETVAEIKGQMPDVGKEYDTLQQETEAKYAKFEKEREASKPKGEAYSGLEALLKKEEDKTADKESRNLQMALVSAGLAIAGGKSQYALQNIAEGAQVGSKQYQAGLEKLEEAAKERQKQFAMIEEARRAEARGDWDKSMELRRQAMDMSLGIRKSKIEGVAKITGDTVKAATDRVNTLDTLASADRRTIFTQQEETKRANAHNKVLEAAYANRGGAGANIPNIVFDNATNLHKNWLNSPEGKLAALTPGAADAKFQEFLTIAARAQGVTLPGMPAAGGAAAPAGSKAKFLGFE